MAGLVATALGAALVILVAFAGKGPRARGASDMAHASDAPPSEPIALRMALPAPASSALEMSLAPRSAADLASPSSSAPPPPKARREGARPAPAAARARAPEAVASSSPRTTDDILDRRK
jgi:hypothetical protein